MILRLFLVTAMLTGLAAAQDDRPKAVPFAKFDETATGWIEMMMDGFFAALLNDPYARGHIINYGTQSDVEAREKQILESIRLKRFDQSRILIVRDGLRPIVRTEIWIVPPGADSPSPDPGYDLVSEFGSATVAERRKKVAAMLERLAAESDTNGVIVVAGPAAAVARRESEYRVLVRQMALGPRIRFVRTRAVGTVSTQLWVSRPPK